MSGLISQQPQQSKPRRMWLWLVVGLVLVACILFACAAGGLALFITTGRTVIGNLTPTAETPEPRPTSSSGGALLDLRLVADPPTTLDPAMVEDSSSAEYVDKIYSGLVGLDENLNVVPEAAERWEVSSDGTVYTFYLRSDVYFHNGRKVTAQDFKYSIERACDPATESPVAGYYLGDTLEGSIGIIEQILISPTSMPHIPPMTDSLSVAAQLRETLASIEMAVSRRLRRTALKPQGIHDANTFFSPLLMAALELGDPALLEPDLEWVKGLLSGRRIEPGHLETYLAAYRRAVTSAMGPAGRPIADWIGSYLARRQAPSRKDRSSKA